MGCVNFHHLVSSFHRSYGGRLKSAITFSIPDLSKATGIVSVSWNGIALGYGFPSAFCGIQFFYGHSKEQNCLLFFRQLNSGNWMLTNNKLIDALISLSARLSIDLIFWRYVLLEKHWWLLELLSPHLLWHDYPNAPNANHWQTIDGRILTHGWNSNSIFKWNTF
jgi:hypothetical protein